MAEFKLLPYNNIELIGSYLKITDYHNFRISSTAIDLPFIARLSLKAYQDSNNYFVLRNVKLTKEVMRLVMLNKEQKTYLFTNCMYNDFYDIERIYKANKYSYLVRKKLFLGCMEHGFLNLGKQILEDPSLPPLSPSCDDNMGLLLAATNNNADCVAQLLQVYQVPPILEGFTNAMKNGHLPVVELYLKCPNFFPEDDGNLALRMSCEVSYKKNNKLWVKHQHCMKKLLSDIRISPSDEGNQALILAAKNGHHGCVLMLAKHKDFECTDFTEKIFLQAAIDKAISWSQRNMLEDDGQRDIRLQL
ncbi:hypothetical protein BC833DRAFT_584738 [Globomyces pollinis-pini]|nr:hypothetical protein BC833DRAFT_584738 [Globomyces pollinis-pini]